MPTKAPAGTVWKFDNSPPNHGNWKAQDYNWAEAGGRKKVGKDQLFKQVFNIRTNDADPKRGNKGFQMYVWSLTQNQDIVIIQFIGDASLAVDIPHGNAKSANARPHHKTAPSTMRDMKESREKPNQYYRQTRANAAPDLVTQVKSIFILV